jgi:hypothetical protein
MPGRPGPLFAACPVYEIETFLKIDPAGTRYRDMCRINERQDRALVFSAESRTFDSCHPRPVQTLMTPRGENRFARHVGRWPCEAFKTCPRRAWCFTYPTWKP